jgi:hypothetical protein
MSKNINESKESKMSKIKASDLGIWKGNEDNLFWSWLPTKSDEVILFDKRQNGKHKVDDPRACGSTFRLRINAVPVFRTYKVTVCGSSGKNATRRREFRTMAQAQAYALKWLDYRIGAELVEVAR